MFRKILLALLISISAASASVGKEREEIFNGKDLKSWDGDPKIWSVEDGVIIGRTTKDAPLKHNEFLIWKGGEVGDFKLTLQYRIKGGNSGIQYRSKVVDPAEWIVAGYQADIDSSPTYTGILYEERERGILAKRGERVTIDKDGKATTEKIGDAEELQKSIQNEDWNDYTIEARGPRLKHTINGKVMSETIDRDRKNRDKTGVLAFQVHAGPPMTIEFRKIRYEKLEPRAKKSDKKTAAKKE